jgi:hypothetical protein
MAVASALSDPPVREAAATARGPVDQTQRAVGSGSIFPSGGGVRSGAERAIGPWPWPEEDSRRQRVVGPPPRPLRGCLPAFTWARSRSRSRSQPAAASRSPSHEGPAGRLAWGGRAGRASTMRARHALPRFGVSLAGVGSCRVVSCRAWRGVASGRDVQRSAAAGGGRACRDLEPRGGPSGPAACHQCRRLLAGGRGVGVGTPLPTKRAQSRRTRRRARPGPSKLPTCTYVRCGE